MLQLVDATELPQANVMKWEKGLVEGVLLISCGGSGVCVDLPLGVFLGVGWTCGVCVKLVVVSCWFKRESVVKSR